MASKAGKRTKDEDKEEVAASGDEAGSDAEGDDKPKPKAKKPKTEKKPKKEKKKVEGLQFNVNKAVDKKHEGKTFTEIISLPPSALQGIGEKHDDMFAEFKINTIAEMAEWKFYKIARAMVVLAATEEKGKRGEKSLMNFNAALDKKFETSTLKELLKASPSALQGLAKWADSTLAEGKIKDIKALGSWKYFQWAEALVELAKYETADGTSK